MIIKLIAELCFGIVEFITQYLPSGNPPAFISGASSSLHDMLLQAHGLSAWIPWSTAIGCAGLLFGLWVVFTSMAALRWLLGWVPTMGGA